MKNILVDSKDNRDLPIIVHSHLRWDFVWQRPQQLLSRFARTRSVLFVEEPMFDQSTSKPRLLIESTPCGVRRAIPTFPAEMGGDEAFALSATRDLLQRAIGIGGELSGHFERPVQWFYTPMPAMTMLGAFNESLVVYDCMDELAQFRFAPSELVQRERYLLARADVVFAGGAGLAEAKSRYHRNVHFFGCGVDVDHFSKARSSATASHNALADVDHPILGYIGVIDERLDYELIARLAEQFPHATVAMVGPVVKVSPAELPKRPNIRWLGQQQFEDLPSFLKQFDVCLMPFAINSATQFINPTKTLEYLATGKPVVSTALTDVVRNYSSLVRIADTIEEFAIAVGEELDKPDLARSAAGVEKATRSSWNAIVEQMDGLMTRALVARNTAPLATTGVPMSGSGGIAVLRSPD